MENISSVKRRLFRSKSAILELLREQQQSGLSIQTFCTQHSIPSGSFHNWKKKYGTIDGGYDNPNAKGRNFVKFDGFDVENNTLVDRKWNITTFPKALNQLRRMSSALRQNPGFKGVIEVPNQAVYNSTINALQKARVDNITVRIAQ